MAAWERRDTAFILDCFTDDAVYHSMPLTPIVGKAAIAAWVKGFEDVPPGRLEVRNQVASGAVVMNERTDSITLNGKPVTLPICAVFEMDGAGYVPGGSTSTWRRPRPPTSADPSGAPRARGADGCLRWGPWAMTKNWPAASGP